MTSPVRLIINADDLGASDAINAAIFEALAANLITSATLMATGGAVDAAARTSRDFPQASFGVHLNLTTHRPVTRNAGLEPLLTPSGDFRPGCVYETTWSRRLSAAVADEWTAQVELVRRAGVMVSHLDSHHHVHTLPWLFPALKQVQRNTGIRRVRGTLSIFDRQGAAGLRRRVTKRAWWWALRSIYPTKTTAEFADFLTFLRAVAEGAYAPREWPGIIELMVHPTDDVAYSGEEAIALRGSWLRTLPVPAVLASYLAL